MVDGIDPKLISGAQKKPDLKNLNSANPANINIDFRSQYAANSSSVTNGAAGTSAGNKTGSGENIDVGMGIKGLTIEHTSTDYENGKPVGKVSEEHTTSASGEVDYSNNTTVEGEADYKKDTTSTGEADDAATSTSKIAQAAGEGALKGTVNELSSKHTSTDYENGKPVGKVSEEHTTSASGEVDYSNNTTVEGEADYKKDTTSTGEADDAATSTSKIAQAAGEGALKGTVNELSSKHTSTDYENGKPVGEKTYTE